MLVLIRLIDRISHTTCFYHRSGRSRIIFKVQKHSQRAKNPARMPIKQAPASPQRGRALRRRRARPANLWWCMCICMFCSAFCVLCDERAVHGASCTTAPTWEVRSSLWPTAPSPPFQPLPLVLRTMPQTRPPTCTNHLPCSLCCTNSDPI